MWPDWKQKLETPIVEGGLRLRNKAKSGTENQPLISYVTVVRDNVETLERTIESVQAQTYENVEHIVIDGDSKDGTLELIQRYKDVIDYYASEPDKGLYDALNKAIPLCRGDLILVLNSDDWLSDDSAEHAASMYKDNTAQLICGTAKVLIDNEKHILWKPQKVTMNSYFSVANLNHNAVYASRKAYEQSGPYDSSYMIAADTKWVLACFDKGSELSYTDEVLVNYSLGGISSDIYWHMEECKRIIKEKFRFLSGDEVIALHYIYYQWREGFKYPLVHFNAKEEISKIIRKYPDKKQLNLAIDLEHDFFSQTEEEQIANTQTKELKLQGIKKLLSRFPVLDRNIRKLYGFFIRKFK